MKALYVGLAGPATAGKTTVARMMVDIYGPGSVIIPFAKPLKDFAVQMGWNGEKDEKGRQLLKLLGTDCGRMCISEDVWTDKWAQACLKAKDAKVIIADDCRFANEAGLITQSGGVIYEIRERGKYSGDHPSEYGLPGFIRRNTILNNGTLTELHLEVRKLVDSWA